MPQKLSRARAATHNLRTARRRQFRTRTMTQSQRWGIKNKTKKAEASKKDWLVFHSRGLCVAMTPDCRDSLALTHTRSWRWRIHPQTSDITTERGRTGQVRQLLFYSQAQVVVCLCEWVILQVFQALVVEAESRISCEVELLEFWRKDLWQSHLSQLIAAQINTLKRNTVSVLTCAHESD